MVHHFVTALALEVELAQKAREHKLINDRQEQALASEKQLRNQDYHEQVWGQWQRIITVFVLGATLLGGPVGYWFGQQSVSDVKGVAERVF
ncbi:hypothetical protein [Acaryochloris sp. CCMEE 5410]|uniref:hypothetical protein n=1 Tax=Acaryochloris sp. CCMEE 5410 TaxID=310037 RepID=UPI000248493A|nr:hypothetical protein [Acaryochloris sp. CCMEE 5410]KAI9129444.1 hypothetical protein ON05_035655 [Acaryochloris sp. CCMEE 5410]